MKLYLVKLRGLSNDESGSPDYQNSYVVADDPSKAYKWVKDYLDKYDLGFSGDRELDSITLIAEAVQYPDCETILFLAAKW